MCSANERESGHCDCSWIGCHYLRSVFDTERSVHKERKEDEEEERETQSAGRVERTNGLEMGLYKYTIIIKYYINRNIGKEKGI